MKDCEPYIIYYLENGKKHFLKATALVNEKRYSFGLMFEVDELNSFDKQFKLGLEALNNSLSVIKKYGEEVLDEKGDINPNFFKEFPQKKFPIIKI